MEIANIIHRAIIRLFLSAAVFWGIVDVIKALLDSGCNVNHQNEGSLWTPLHAATFQEHGKVYTYYDIQRLSVASYPGLNSNLFRLERLNCHNTGRLACMRLFIMIKLW